MVTDRPLHHVSTVSCATINVWRGLRRMDGRKTFNAPRQGSSASTMFKVQVLKNLHALHNSNLVPVWRAAWRGTSVGFAQQQSLIGPGC